MLSAPEGRKYKGRQSFIDRQKHRPGLVYLSIMSANKTPAADTKEGLSPHPESPAPSDLEVSKRHLVDNTDEDEEFSYEEQRKIVHRIDRRLVVILGLMYCVSLIDRGNMPNAVCSSSSSSVLLP